MEDEKSQVEKLQDAIIAQAAEVSVRNKERHDLKSSVKQAEENLHRIKHNHYLAEKRWVAARKKLKTLIGRKSGLGARQRQWCKKNLGKVLTEMMK